MVQFCYLFDSKLGQIWALDWVRNCHFIQLSDDQVLRY
uniref:Uncharacterized protein n=1 Tax=Arundo donax TaxID=35708 RepID=A0A0A9F3Q1_ARUDO